MTRVELLPDGQAPLLDRYQIIGRISSGGMGVVWLGRLGGVGGFQRLVAIKQLHPHLATEAEFVEMFLDEARLAAGIHHHHVVSILEVGTAEGGYYLVMEYIEGSSLSEVNTRAAALGRTVPSEVMLRILLDTLSGLHAAHELCDQQGKPLGLVHRDCTPQNILLGLDGCVKITDFGIARASARLANTREGAFKGKLAYMAPEQTQGDDIDRRADLFSVGVILWEALTNRRLFKGKTDAQTLTRLLNMPIPRVRDVAADIHPQLDAVCAKALERDPVLRFQTAEEMADALERAARAASNGRDDQISTVRALSAYLGDLLGQEITTQRESVRVWLARAENTPPPRSFPTSSQRPPSSQLPAPTLRGLGRSETGGVPAAVISGMPPPDGGEDEVTLREQLSDAQARGSAEAAVPSGPVPSAPPGASSGHPPAAVPALSSGRVPATTGPMLSSGRVPSTLPTPGAASPPPSGPRPVSGPPVAGSVRISAPPPVAPGGAGPTLASEVYPSPPPRQPRTSVPPGALEMPAPSPVVLPAPFGADGSVVPPAPSTIHPAGLPSSPAWRTVAFLAVVLLLLIGGGIALLGRGSLWGVPPRSGEPVVADGQVDGRRAPEVPLPSSAPSVTLPATSETTTAEPPSAPTTTALSVASSTRMAGHGGDATPPTATATAKPVPTRTGDTDEDIKNPYR